VVDLYEIQWGGDAIEGDLDIILLNTVPSTIPKFQTSEVDAVLHQQTWEHEMLYADTASSNEQLSITPFFSKSQKYEV
jgi:hypothetical protein